MRRLMAQRLSKGPCSLLQQRLAHGGRGGFGLAPRRDQEAPRQRQRGGFGLASSPQLSGPRADMGSSSSRSRPRESSGSSSSSPWTRSDHSGQDARGRDRDAASPRRRPFGFKSSAVEREPFSPTERGSRRDGIRYKSDSDKPTTTASVPGSDSASDPGSSSRSRPSRSFDDLISGEIRTSLLREDVLARARAANTVIDTATSQTITTVPSEKLGAAGDLDTFFSGFQDPVEASSEIALPKLSPPPTVAARPFATYIAPTESGVALIKKLLQQHKFLTTKQIWDFGTQGLKPPLPQTIAFEADGSIKMKRVSTMREGRRPWVPPKEPSFPDHPFRSVRFLKETILASLEDNGVIHKAAVLRPLETEEEHQAAIRTAESQNRKAERRHVRLNLPAPLVKMPATTKQIWGWLPGPRYKGMTPLQVALEKQRAHAASKRQQAEEAEQAAQMDVPPHLALSRPTDEPSHKAKPAEPAVKPPLEDENGIHYGWPVPPPIEQAMAAEYEFDDEKWNRAAQAEFQYHYLKLREAEVIAERQAVRRAKAKEQRDAEKLQRQEDIATGAIEVLKKEQRRMEALQNIEEYAKMTGQDVSGWFDELSDGEVGESPKYVPQHQSQGGAIPRGRENARSGMRPLGFPIN